MELRRTKNLATYVTFPIQKNDGTYITSAAGLDSELNYWDDGNAPQATFTDCTNEATEIGTTGIYYLSITQAEMNHDYIVIQIKSSTTGALTQTILINTTNQNANLVNIAGSAVSTTTAQLGVNMVQISTDATAADNLELIIETAKGTDHKILLSTDAQDLSGTLDVNAKTIGASAVSSIMAGAVEGTVTIAQACRALLAFACGKASGGGTSTITYRNIADDADRLVLTVDANGNRSAVTRTLT